MLSPYNRLIAIDIASVFSLSITNAAPKFLTPTPLKIKIKKAPVKTSA
nr:MAG TPA: hypothetical protein [Caudoviricetes sp.]